MSADAGIGHNQPPEEPAKEKVKPNPPGRHHYLPQFYLKRWLSGADNQLTEFSQPVPNSREVKTRRRSTEATGFVKRLYAFEGPHDEADEHLERTFFAPTDHHASEALDILERGDPGHVWSEDDRSAWSMFITSLMLRMPEDIATIKRFVAAEWREIEYADLRRKFSEHPDLTNGETFDEWIARERPNFPENSGMELAAFLMQHDSVVESINQMHWVTVDTHDAPSELLTSDRPIMMTPYLRQPGSHIIMPIGPRRLFIAAEDRKVLDAYNARGLFRTVRSLNDDVVSHAVSYVYGTSDALRGMVSWKMATKRQPRLADKLAEISQLRLDRAAAGRP